MSIETNIRVRVKNWRDDYFKPKHALITIISIMIVFSSANAWVLGILPFDSSRIPNNSCRSSNEYKSWLSVRMKIRGSLLVKFYLNLTSKAYLMIFGIVPYALFFVSNLFLMHFLFGTVQHSERRAILRATAIFILFYSSTIGPAILTRKRNPIFFHNF